MSLWERRLEFALVVICALSIALINRAFIPADALPFSDWTTALLSVMSFPKLAFISAMLVLGPFRWYWRNWHVWYC